MRKLLLVLAGLSGCTERWIQIRSDPPGATVHLDGRDVGKTPVQVRFTWYGDREVVLEKEGYRTRVEIVSVLAPWWQGPPFDLITDVLLPFTVTDRQEFRFELRKFVFDAAEEREVRGRAEELRKRARENP